MRKAWCITFLAVLMAGVAQAQPAQQSNQQSANCTIEDANLQMVEKDRKADERQIAQMAVNTEQDRRRIAALEAQVKYLVEQLAKAEKNAAQAAP